MSKKRQRSGHFLLRKYFSAERGLQAKCAAETGIDQARLSQIAAGARRPTIAEGLRLQDATGVSVESWLVREGSRAKSEGAAQ
jgi:plasmid maintenance system antidote protein VapI